MCGRFALDARTDDLIRQFVIAGGDYQDWTPSWNIKPTQPVAVILETAKGEDEPLRRLEHARWGLVPSWSKELKTKFPTFNARSETAAEKASFKASVRSKRAIIPATGYYEWQTNPDSGLKTPHFIRPKDGELMAMASLYTWWKDPTATGDDDDWHLTTTIFTSDAVHTMDHNHDRNPVPLPQSFWDIWLDPTVAGDQALVDEAVRAALPVAEDLDWYPVGKVTGDSPTLIQPAQ